MSRVLLWVLLKGPDEKMGEAQPPLHENLQQSGEDKAKTRITLPEGRCYGQSRVLVSPKIRTLKS